MAEVGIAPCALKPPAALRLYRVAMYLVNKTTRKDSYGNGGQLWEQMS